MNMSQLERILKKKLLLEEIDGFKFLSSYKDHVSARDDKDGAFLCKRSEWCSRTTSVCGTCKVKLRVEESVVDAWQVMIGRLKKAVRSCYMRSVTRLFSLSNHFLKFKILNNLVVVRFLSSRELALWLILCFMNTKSICLGYGLLIGVILLYYMYQSCVVSRK